MVKNGNWLILFTFTLCSLFFARTNSIFVNDTYWHLAVGQEFFETKKIPQQDNFTYGSQNTRYVSTEWLSGAIFYKVYSALHNYGFPLLRLLVGLGSLFFIYKTFLIFTEDKFLHGFLLFTSAYLISFTIGNRPEMFSTLFIVLTNYVCLKFYYQKTISKAAYLLPLVFAAWPNIHPYSIVGIGLVSFFAILISFEQKLCPQKRKNYFTFMIIALISTAVCVDQYQRVLVFGSATKLQYIAELVNLKDRISHQGSLSVLGSLTSEIYLYLLVIVFYSAALIRNRKLNLLNFFYFAILLSPIKYYRLIPPVLLLVLPQFTQLAKIPHSTQALKLAYFFSLMVIVISLLLGHTLGAGKDNPMTFSPSQTDNFIRNNLNTKRIFTLSDWNDYYIWNLKGVKTFSDAMPLYRTRESLEEENYLVKPENNPEALLAKYDIDTVVNTQTGAIWGSATNIASMKNWRLVYINQNAIIYARRDIIKNAPVDLSAIDPYLKSDLEFEPQNKDLAVKQLRDLLAFDPQNFFARNQLILNDIYENRFNEAQQLALESRNIYSDKTYANSFFLTITYANLNNCQQASEFAKEATAKDRKTSSNQILKKILKEKCSLEI